jgi:predicted XRE-type DNA-binding protein
MTEINETQVPELKEKLIKEIEKEITKKGLSQAQVGELAGMSRVNINKLLRGTEKSVALNQLVKVANSLGIEIDLVFKRVQNKR